MDMSIKIDQPPGPLFIALSGKKQTGKDTVTSYAVDLLKNQTNYEIGVTAFAESLKETAIGVLGLPRELVYGTNDDKETKTHIMWDSFPDSIRIKYSKEIEYQAFGMVPRMGPMTIREVLQVMGTDVFREMFESDVWANSPFRRDWTGYDIVFITDCRFPNEVEAVLQHGGRVVRLTRDTGFMDAHPSETALDDYKFDLCYENNGSLEDLSSFVRKLLVDLELLH